MLFVHRFGLGLCLASCGGRSVRGVKCVCYFGSECPPFRRVSIRQSSLVNLMRRSSLRQRTKVYSYVRDVSSIYPRAARVVRAVRRSSSLTCGTAWITKRSYGTVAAWKSRISDVIVNPRPNPMVPSWPEDRTSLRPLASGLWYLASLSRLNWWRNTRHRRWQRRSLRAQYERERSDRREREESEVSVLVSLILKGDCIQSGGRALHV